ncbi:flagellar brake domain-containing protein [Clostridium subterminale]|uniref:Flagellar brake domain-containing protein n=1 Tax=Clostridium subterminale TaxID=1550 RepID=A0ABP3VRN2_CLOSU
MKANNMMEINNKIEIYTKNCELAKSIVQDMDEEGIYIAIATPILNGISYPLTTGDTITCNYNDGKGNIYSFQAKVKGRKFDNIAMIILERESELKKVQRRDHVRIPFMNKVKYLPIDKYNESMLRDIENCDYREGQTLDLSGGGIRIKVKESLDLGQLVMLNTKINNQDILALGKIVRDETQNKNEHIYGVKFKYIDAKVRESIIQFIFQNMRKLMKTK